MPSDLETLKGLETEYSIAVGNLIKKINALQKPALAWSFCYAQF